MDALVHWLDSLPLARILAVTMLTLARVAPVVFIVPALGGANLPTTARSMVAFVLTAACWPFAWQSAVLLPTDTLLVSLLAVKEGLVGTVMGLFVALFFLAAQAAGRIVDMVRGSQMASITSPQTADPTSPMGLFFMLLAVVIFLSLRGHLLLIAALARSYELVPLGMIPVRQGWASTAALAVRLGTDYFLIALGLAAPILAASFLLDLAVGLVGRASPQLPAYFIGLPLKAWGGVAVVFVTLPLLVAFLERISARAVQVLTQAVLTLASGS